MTQNVKAANKIMSGLDGLGWPNPKDEPKPKKTMNSQLEIKLAPTPETDAIEYFDAMCDPDRVVEAEFARKLERERDEWKAKYIQQNKDLGCEMMDPNGTIWDYAKKVQHELTVVTKQRDQLEGRLRVELGGHPESELWGDAGLIAATMRCVDALDAATEQRNRLAAAVNAATVLIAAKGRHNTQLAYEGLRSALSPQNARDLAPPPQMPELDK